VAEAVEPAYTRPWRTDNRNNHAYWAGLAVAATGDTVGDPALVAWGLRQAEVGITQIRPDGTLPLEMERGARALHYHLFALTPLVMLAEIGLRHGAKLYAARHGALRRLAERALAGLDDPAWFAVRAGAPQDAPGHLPPEDVAWMEPYYARFRDPGLEPWLDRLRPVRSARLGGDVTAQFAPGTS
jgi:poly(beta-D-mannuronate) lyase